MVDYGSGIALDENYDIAVASDGDIKTVSGVDEVKKDLAFTLGAALYSGHGVDRPESLTDGVIGKTLTSGTEADVQILVNNIIGQDERIESIQEIRTATDAKSNELEIVARVSLVTGDRETFEFIIPL